MYKRICLAVIMLLVVSLLSACAPPAQPAPGEAELPPSEEAATDKGCGGDGIGVANPAALQCLELGYEYQVVDELLGQAGYCVFPDGDKCEGWEFFSGKCGQEHSYCALNGYELRTVSDGRNPFSPEYAVCTSKGGKRIGSVVELMGLVEKATVGKPALPREPSDADDITPSAVMSPGASPPPERFSWWYSGSPGGGYMSPVKDQGGCGSCWAFAAVGVVEAAWNIHTGDPDLDLDLSEQQLVSQGGSPSSDCYYGGWCCGGNEDFALEWIRDRGITDEACFAYDDGHTGCVSNRSCYDKCPEWRDRLWSIVKVQAPAAMNSIGLWLTWTDVKWMLIHRGPVATALNMNGKFEDGIYRCDAIDPDKAHAVVIVGYDDPGQYWIVRNSWGSGWGDDGYFKLGYGECAMGPKVHGARLGDNAFPIPDAGGPYVADEGSRTELTLDASGSSDPDGDDVLAYIWDPLPGIEHIQRRYSPYKTYVAEKADDWSTEVMVRVYDGGYNSWSDLATIIVQNVPPSVDAEADQSIYEGDEATLWASFTDPGYDDPDAGTVEDFTARIDWGDGTSESVIPDETPGSKGVDTVGRVEASHVYADDGVYTVEVCVKDDDMDDFVDESCDTITVTVHNVAPTAHAGADQVVYEGDIVTLDPAAFHDQGTLDAHTATVDWGDGLPPEDAVVSESPFGPPGSTAGADGTVTASHQYLAGPGTYPVTVCVRDDDGAETCDSLNVTVFHGFLRFCAYADDEHDGATVQQDAVLLCLEVPSGVPGEMRPSGVGSRGKVDVKEKVTIQGILSSLSDKIDVGKETSVYGTLTAGHDVKVDERAHIGDSITSGHKVEVKKESWVDGDITAAGDVKVDKKATVTGSINEFASVPPLPVITWVQFSFEPGTEKVTVEKDAILTLPPGSYKDVKVKERGTLILSGQNPFGQYVFKKLEMEKDAQLQFDLSGGPVVIDVAENLEFKDNVQIVSAGDARDILFRVAGDKVELGKEGTYLGTFLAPNAEVKLGDDAALYGALYGKKVDIGKRVTLGGLPARDLFAFLFVNP